MGSRKKRPGHGAGPGDHAKELHKKRLRDQALGVPAATVLNARPEVPSLKSKHHSYYEIVENKDKKKKLELQITSKKTPPPGFEFVPMGNPELTTACKEISREKDAMIFIVSSRTEVGSLSQHTNRIGHHIRQTIVEEARKAVNDGDRSSEDLPAPGVPEPIPATQEEINEQADKAIRDLFPRIPHTDRQLIIEHSFKKGATKKGEPLVGLAQDIPLSRRVQLAALAHIRHTHTRYDKLLKETTYINARKAVEQLCLDVLVKWRGDEETGRDQLDEILREVIVISDSESDDDNDEDAESDSSGVESGDLAENTGRLRYSVAPASHIRVVPRAHAELRHPPSQEPYPVWQDSVPGLGPPRSFYAPAYARESPGAKRARRGFKRYEAALAARWDEARDRVRLQEGHPLDPPRPSALGPPSEHQTYSALEPLYQEPRPAPAVLHHYDLQETSYDRDAHIGNPHPLDLPPHHGPVPVSSAPAPRRVFSDGIPRGNGSPYNDPWHREPAQRVLVRAEDARDFLVPSVEPLSPSAEAPPLSAVPVFVRTVSPRQTSRPPPRDFPEKRPGQFGARHSPSWGGDGPVSFKRRRGLDSGPQSRLEPTQYDRPGHDERQLPAYYSGGPQREIPSHAPMERASQPRFSPPRPLVPLVGAPVPAPELQSYDRSRAEPPYIVEQREPVNLESWDRRPSPFVAARNYRETIGPERRETRLIEVREDVRHPQEIQHRQNTPAGYGHPPAHAQYRPLQDRPPANLGYLAEQPVAYGHHSPFVDETYMPPAGYQPPAYPASHTQYHNDYAEPEPVFIRQVERPSYYYLAPEQRQPGQQYGEDALRGVQPPLQANDAWGQPYDRVFGPPHNAPIEGAAAHPYYLADGRHPASGDSVYHRYPERRNMPSTQDGP